MKEYQALLSHVVGLGKRKQNRTGVDTIGVFGHMQKYDLSAGFPLVTTKKMFWKGIVHELLWFLSGNTNIQYLLRNGANFWTDDAYRHYQKTTIDPKLSKEEFVEIGKKDEDLSWYDLGYGTYGSMWRAFPKGDQSVDQIKKAIDTLRTKPDDRRIIISAWHPGLVEDIALPPCHVMFQLNTEKDGTGKYVLNLALYQRSCDLFLGVPFNIASYALLLKMLAHCCNMSAGTFTHMYGDLHIYVNHLAAVTELLARTPCEPPTVHIHRPVGCELDEIKFEDIELRNYVSHPCLKAELNTKDVTV